MKNIPKPLTLEEIIAQGGIEGSEEAYDDEHGFEYSGSDNAFLYYGGDESNGGKPFTGLYYELFPNGKLESYAKYENGMPIEDSFEFYENGKIKTYNFVTDIIKHMNGTDNNAGAAATHSMVLRTEGLVKRYGKRTVVNDVSINVRQGEIVGLLGPNGAGKTTSFYMTTGLIVPNAGHIYLDDKDITDYPVYKRARAGVGYLPQEASVFRKMSVEDNILSVLEMTGQPRARQLEKLESLISEFRLNKVRKNKGDQLSGGERRRTEIARCLAIDPKFIMLDEPFAGVDPIAVEDIQHIVWRLKYRNIGILITDHNVHETLNITDRAYLLFEGKILFQGAPEELAANKVVREKYLSNSFELKKKNFQLIDEERRARENAAQNNG